LIAKMGLDGHDRGAHVISRAFRDAGFEVIYSGLHQTPEEIVTAAIEEDVDVIGISILSGAHNTLIPPVLEQLDDEGRLDELLVILGGIIPDADRDGLLAAGVDAIFGPGTPMDQTVAFVEESLGAASDA
jgi:methylmalonyl-CoA mutase C-terminal domain/subunit